MTNTAPQTPQPQNFKEYWARVRNDVLLFFTIIKFKPTSDQREIALATQECVLHPVQVPERILVKAGTGTGKSAIAAALALWLLLRTYGTKVIVTAPTERQVRTVLMSEIRQHIRRGPTWFQEMFEVHLTKVNLRGNDDWQILPITASEATSVQGQHHHGLAIIVEEVSGVDDEILDAFMRTLSQRGNFLLGIGNPNHRQGLLFRAFTSVAHLWPRKFTMNKLRLSQERPDIADPKAIEQILKEYGEDSYQYRVGVLGEFPLTEGQTVMDYGALVRAANTSKHLAIKMATNPWRRRISNDFARFGGDQNVVAALAGNAVMEFHKLQCEPIDAVRLGFAIQERRAWRNEHTTYIPDSVGLGQGLLVQFDRAGKQWVPYGSNHASPSPEYENAESAAWFQLKALLEIEIVSLPADPDLIEQLATRIYKYMPATNKIKVESKEEYKKRTKQRSPDEADAIVQLFYDPLLVRAGEVIAGSPTSFKDQQAQVLAPGMLRAFDETEPQSFNPGSIDLFIS